MMPQKKSKPSHIMIWNSTLRLLLFPFLSWLSLRTYLTPSFKKARRVHKEIELQLKEAERVRLKWNMNQRNW